MEIKQIESLAGGVEAVGDGPEQEFIKIYRELPKADRKVLILQALDRIPELSSPCRSRLRAALEP